MAVKPWPQIFSLTDAAEYIQAELNEAQAYCPTAVANYQQALDLVKGEGSWDVEAQTTNDTLAQAKQMLDSARATWHAMGCGKLEPATVVQPPAPGKDDGTYVPGVKQAGMLGGSTSSTLLIGVVAGLAVWLIWGKKGSKTRARRSTRRRARRRRR